MSPDFDVQFEKQRRENEVKVKTGFMRTSPRNPSFFFFFFFSIAFTNAFVMKCIMNASFLLS